MVVNFMRSSEILDISLQGKIDDFTTPQASKTGQKTFMTPSGLVGNGCSDPLDEPPHPLIMNSSGKSILGGRFVIAGCGVSLLGEENGL